MQPTTFRCTQCGAPLPPGVTRCPNCGMTFAAPVPMTAPPGFAPPAKKPVSVAAILGIVAAVGCLPLIILPAILFPIFSKARDKARETSSASNLKQIGLATLEFAQDHDEKLPPTDTMANFKASVSSYIPPQGMTPQNNDDLFVETGANVPYVLNPQVSKKPLDSIPHPETVEIAREAVAHSDGKINILYADGHVTLEPASGGEQGQ